MVNHAMVKAAGFFAPDFALYDHRPSTITDEKCPHAPFYRLATFIEKTTTPHDQAVANKLGDRFVFDAFSGNRDIVEKHGDVFKNVILAQNGLLYSVDHGSTIRYRALGERRVEGQGFISHRISELKTMRDATYSRHGCETYQRITDDAIRLQATELFARQAKILRTIKEINHVIGIDDYDSFNSMLLGRIKHLHELAYGLREIPPSSMPLADTFLLKTRLNAAAGVFLYIDINGQAYTMLGQRDKHRWYGNLGGHSEPSDRHLGYTAIREAYEESKSLVDIDAETVVGYASHDLITDENLYRMYFYPYRHIDVSNFNGVIAKDSASNEISDLVYVSIADLVHAVVFGPKIVEEGRETVKVMAAIDPTKPAGGSKEIIIYADLYTMLRQRAVLQSLRLIAGSKTPRPAHTQGFANTGSDKADFGDYVARDKDKVQWSKVPTDRLTTEAVAFGQDAAGNIHQERSFGVKEGQRTETRWHNRELDEHRLFRSINDHAAAMIEFKGRSPLPIKAGFNSDLPYVQTEAHLIATMSERQDVDAMKSYASITDDNANVIIPGLVVRFLKILSLLGDSFYKIDSTAHPYVVALSKAWLEERNHRDKVVGYHGSDPLTGIIYDIATELRSQLMLISGHDIAIVRALDRAIAGLFTADDFKREQMIKQGVNSPSELSNYGADYTQKGVSMNPAIFGSDGRGSSATFLYLWDAFSAQPPDYNALLKHVNQSVGIDIELNDLIATLAQFGLDKAGRLFQFFFDRKVADDLLYLSYTGGRSMELSGLTESDDTVGDISKFVKSLRTDPVGFLSHLPTGTKINDVQLRMFANNNRLEDRDSVMVKKYWSTNPSNKLLQEYGDWLKRYVRAKLNKILINRAKIPEVNFLTVAQSRDKYCPLQRLTKYVYQGSSGEEYNIRPLASLLPEALYNGDLELVKLIVGSEGININREFTFVTAGGATIDFHPFKQACAHGNIGLAQLVVDHGYSVSGVDIYENSRSKMRGFIREKYDLNESLLNAVNSNDIEGLKISIDKGAVDSGHALSIATAENHFPLAEVLIARFSYGENSLHETITHAITFDQQAFVSKLVKEQKVHLNYPSPWRDSFISTAISSNHAGMAKLLVDLGVKIIDPDAAIKDAIKNQNWEMLNVLFSQATDIRAAKISALRYDLEQSHTGFAIAKRLLAEDASLVNQPFKVRDQRWSQLANMAAKNKREVVELLLAYGADISNDDAVFQAASNGHVEMVSFLMKQHRYPASILIDITTALILHDQAHAVSQLVQQLVEQKVDLSRTDFLLTAAQHGKWQMLKSLLAIDISFDWNGIQFAIKEKQPDIIHDWLKKPKYQANSDILRGAFAVGIEKGHLGLVELAFQQYNRFNPFDRQYKDITWFDDDLLSQAIGSGNVNVVKWLLELCPSLKTSRHLSYSYPTDSNTKEMKEYLNWFSENSQALISAVKRDDISAASTALLKGASVHLKSFVDTKPDQYPIRGRHPLIYHAIRQASVNMVDLLIRHGAELSTEVDDELDVMMHHSLLGLAVKFDKPEIAKFLLDKKPFNDALACFYQAIGLNRPDVVKVLLDSQQFDPKRAINALTYAAAHRNSTEAMAVLLERKLFDADDISPEGITPLFVAIAYNSIDNVKALLRHGARRIFDRSRLHQPSPFELSRCHQITSLLLEYGYDFAGKVDAIVGMALRENEPGLIMTLLNKVAEAELENRQQLLNRILQMLIEPNYYRNFTIGIDRNELVVEVIKRGADVFFGDGSQLHSPHSIASDKTSYMEDALRSIILGADRLNVHQRNARGRTFLHYAVEENNLEVVKLLVERGAYINEQTSQHGYTPLHFAIRNGCHEIAEFLKAKSADQQIKDKRHGLGAGDANLTPARHKKVTGQGINQQNKRGQTMLHIAVKEGFSDMVKLLTIFGADNAIKDKQGRIAAEYNSIEQLD